MSLPLAMGGLAEPRACGSLRLVLHHPWPSQGGWAHCCCSRWAGPPSLTSFCSETSRETKSACTPALGYPPAPLQALPSSEPSGILVILLKTALLTCAAATKYPPRQWCSTNTSHPLVMEEGEDSTGLAVEDARSYLWLLGRVASVCRIPSPSHGARRQASPPIKASGGGFQKAA